MILVVAIFSALFVFIATMYSLAQFILNEGRERWTHLAIMLVVLAIFASLELRSVVGARLLALPLFCLTLWAMWIEERWFKVFPLLQMMFAIVLLLGLVAI
ncbi:MAG: hypothetical protein AAFZ09_16235 [Pseudomonadota bacterium]